MSESGADRPNVLLVIVDDMGSYQMGCYGNQYFETPNLDAFAKEGVLCSRSYATSPVCSPARASIYTGQHPARLHLTNFIPGSAPDNPRLVTPDWQQGLPVSEPTLGDVFKGADYDTVHIGKWHLAENYEYEPHRPMDPESHGFDEVFVTRKPKSTADPEADAHNVEKLTKQTIEFLRKPHEAPFLCVLAHNAIHRPEMAPAKLVERFESKTARPEDWREPVLAAMTWQVDESFGRIMEALEGEGLKDNTIVVFTADHGAMSVSEEPKPWRGSKANLYEAGLRVPFLIRFPSEIEGGYELDGAVSLADLYPTLLDLCGMSESDRPSDGVSIAPWLKGDRSGSPHDALYWHFPHYHHLGPAPCGAMIRGRYKLVEWYESSIGGSDSGSAYELYDLGEDPYERADVSDTLPDIRDEMARGFQHWKQTVGAQEMKVNPDFDSEKGGQRSEPPPADKEDRIST